MAEPWNRLQFGTRTFYPDVRLLGEMAEVIFDQEFLATASRDMALYYMFREVAKSAEDANKIKERDLRYDITIIPPRTLGREFIKTAGHYHPRVPGSTLTYPEIYEVLEGEAHYLLQKREVLHRIERITDVIFVIARSGDKVIIPPQYGHVTINPSTQVLKMANWVARTFSSIYEPYKQHGGAAYFELTTGAITKNERYKEVPPLRILQPEDTWIKEMGLRKQVEMYQLLQEPEKLAFLLQPEGWFP